MATYYRRLIGFVLGGLPDLFAICRCVPVDRRLSSPLINGGGNYATDWGTIAIVRPEIVTIPVAIGFTAFAYLYMSFHFISSSPASYCFTRSSMTFESYAKDQQRRRTQVRALEVRPQSGLCRGFSLHGFRHIDRYRDEATKLVFSL